MSADFQKKVDSSIIISSNEYGCYATLGAFFFSLKGYLSWYGKKGENVKKSAGCHWILIFLCDSYLLESPFDDHIEKTHGALFF